MKFDVEKSALIEPLQRVVNVLERRQTLPILSHVLIECSESGIVLVGTDQEIELSARISIDNVVVSGVGAITVPGRKLLDIVRHLPEGVVISCEAEADLFILRSQRFESQLATLPASEFPWIDLAVIADDPIKCSGKALKTLLSRPCLQWLSRMFVIFSMVCCSSLKLAYYVALRPMASASRYRKPRFKGRQLARALYCLGKE